MIRPDKNYIYQLNKHSKDIKFRMQVIEAETDPAKKSEMIEKAVKVRLEWAQKNPSNPKWYIHEWLIEDYN